MHNKYFFLDAVVINTMFSYVLASLWEYQEIDVLRVFYKQLLVEETYLIFHSILIQYSPPYDTTKSVIL